MVMRGPFAVMVFPCPGLAFVHHVTCFAGSLRKIGRAIERRVLGNRSGRRRHRKLLRDHRARPHLTV